MDEKQNNSGDEKPESAEDNPEPYIPDGYLSGLMSPNPGCLIGILTIIFLIVSLVKFPLT